MQISSPEVLPVFKYLSYSFTYASAKDKARLLYDMQICKRNLFIRLDRFAMDIVFLYWWCFATIELFIDFTIYGNVECAP